MSCLLLKTSSILDFLHPAKTMSLIFHITIEWNDPFCMQWFHNTYPRININSWAFLPFFMCFSIWREYQDCASLHKKDLQLLDKLSGWKMSVILFGMAHILLLDCFTSEMMALVQWPLNMPAISSHCWSTGRDNFVWLFWHTGPIRL